MVAVVRRISLRDLARPPVQVEISDGILEVRKVTNRGWLRLLERFPKLEDYLDRPKDAPMTTELRKFALDLMPAVIIEGLRAHEDPEAIGFAEELSNEDQEKLFTAIMNETTGPGSRPTEPAPTPVRAKRGAKAGKARATPSLPQ